MNSEQAKTVVERSLDTCVRTQADGRVRLAIIRAELLKAGVEHPDTRELCEGMGFKVRGLQIMTEEEAASA